MEYVSRTINEKSCKRYTEWMEWMDGQTFHVDCYPLTKKVGANGTVFVYIEINNSEGGRHMHTPTECPSHDRNI